MCYGSNNDWDCGACPTTQPTGSCVSGNSSLTGIRCLYGAMACTCSTTTGQWQCANANGCPGNPPTAGASCNLPPSQVCTWGAKQCACVQGSWYCK